MEKTIRTFGRSELAQQYFPQISPMSAWRKFREWLVLNPSLRSLASVTRRTICHYDKWLSFNTHATN